MHILRLAGLLSLMRKGWLAGLAALSLIGVAATSWPGRAADLAMTSSPQDSRVVLDLRKRQISVIRGLQRLGPWPVAIGDPKTPTPKGEFAIINKKVNPIYVSHKSGQRKELSGPSSPIGDRYMAFHRNGRGEFGIHGTAWPHWVQIRAAVSLGCVRMLNDHVRQLFDAVDVGTTVEIRGGDPGLNPVETEI